MSQSISPEANKAADYALIDDALNGNQEAFRTLVQKYENVVALLIRKVIHNQAEIDDLKQEVFIKAFNSLHTFKREYAFSTWLFRIATNHAIDFLRKKQLATYSMEEALTTSDGELRQQYATSSPTPEARLIAKEATTHIHRAIKKLPEKYRICIEMRHQEDKSYEEIAAELDLPLGTVKARIFRARELLNRELKDMLSER
jgi:RNA polymerase sigma factor (sigma-70 family)